MFTLFGIMAPPNSLWFSGIFRGDCHAAHAGVDNRS